jgi:preprotein translocase subunit SecG
MKLFIIIFFIIFTICIVVKIFLHNNNDDYSINQFKKIRKALSIKSKKNDSSR